MRKKKASAAILFHVFLFLSCSLPCVISNSIPYNAQPDLGALLFLPTRSRGVELRRVGEVIGEVGDTLWSTRNGCRCPPHRRLVRLRGGLPNNWSARRPQEERFEGHVAQNEEPKAGESNARASVKETQSQAGSNASDEGDDWKPLCRICYEDDVDGLFSPCVCSGSMGLVHR